MVLVLHFADELVSLRESGFLIPNGKPRAYTYVELSLSHYSLIKYC